MAVIYEPFDVDELGNVRPTKEIIGMKYFNEIWSRDTSEQKSKAIADFSYIHYWTCPKKSNQYFAESQQDGNKARMIIKDIKFIPNDYEPDGLVYDAIAFLEEKYEQIFTVGFLKDCILGADKLRSFLRDVDLTELNDKGTSTLYKPRDIQSIIENIDSTVSNLKKAQEEAHEDFKKASKYTKDKVPGYYEF